MNFRHPSAMPELLSSVSGLFLLSGDLPFPMFSNLLPEVLFCGRPIITDNPDILQSYQADDLSPERFKQYILPVSTDDSEAAGKIISEHAGKAYTPIDASNQSQTISAKDHQTYISENENAILSILR
jgi:hypothetical protein